MQNNGVVTSPKSEYEEAEDENDDVTTIDSSVIAFIIQLYVLLFFESSTLDCVGFTIFLFCQHVFRCFSFFSSVHKASVFFLGFTGNVFNFCNLFLGRHHISTPSRVIWS